MNRLSLRREFSMKRNTLTIATALVLLAASMIWALSTGPENGRTGAPGESNCTVGCHSSFALNSGDGSYSITVPTSYIPGDTLDIQLNIADPGQQRWGFEITVLDNADQPVGELIVTEPTRTQKSTDISTGREYIKHTALGTDAGTADVGPGWTLKWASPTVPAGDVTFYAAGNAANWDLTNLGDYIYTTSAAVTQTPVACCIADRGNANGDPDDKINISDVTFLTSYLFGIPSGPAPSCTEEANANGDPDEKINISDVTYLTSYLFGIPAGPAPPPCPQALASR